MKPHTSTGPRVAAFLFALCLALPGCSTKDSTFHPTPSEEFDSGTLSTNESYAHTFLRVGSFAYECRFHAGMVGVVNVTAHANDSVVVYITNHGYSGQKVDVRPGGYVRWVNIGTPHSVTRP